MTLVALLLVKAVSHVLLPTCWHGFIWSAVFTHLEHIVMGAGRLSITRLFERISLLNNLTKREKYWLFPSVFLFSIRYPALKLLISMRQTYMMCGVMYSVYVCVCVLLCWHKDILMVIILHSVTSEVSYVSECLVLNQNKQSCHVQTVELGKKDVSLNTEHAELRRRWNIEASPQIIHTSASLGRIRLRKYVFNGTFEQERLLCFPVMFSLSFPNCSVPSVSIHRLWSHLQKQWWPRHQVQHRHKWNGDSPDKHNICEYILLVCRVLNQIAWIYHDLNGISLISTRSISTWRSILSLPIWSTYSSLMMWNR